MTVSMPIRPLKLPSAVTPAMNGNVPEALLADPGDGKGKLLKVFALCMQALHVVAAQSGIILTTTGRGRTLERQRALFLERYEPCSYTQYLAAQLFKRGKQWTNEHNNTGHRYWRKKQLAGGGYPATAATPGTSNHGLHAADDMAEIVGGKVVSLRHSTLQWLYANAPALGIGWELASEPWHVHTLVGDVVPVRVLETLAMTPPPPPTPSLEEEYMIPAVAKSTGPHLVQFTFRGPIYTMGHTAGHDVTPEEAFGRGAGKAFDVVGQRIVSYADRNNQGSWGAVKATVTEADARALLAR